MIPLLIFIALTGAVFVRHVLSVWTKRSVQTRAVVKGDTFLDGLEKDTVHLPRRLVEIRRVCVLGTGNGDIAALTALVVAERNPHVLVDTADRDTSRIAAWNSDFVPVTEPGVDELLFDEALEVKSTMYNHEIRRKRRLANVAFSTDVAGCIAGADMIFLFDGIDIHVSCLYPRPGTIAHTLQTIRTITRVSTNHKIIVYKGHGDAGKIKEQLNKSPTAIFDLLTSPDFFLLGNIIHSLVHPSRIVIGKEADKHACEAAVLLKKLYTWVPADRILLTDTWSAELGHLATNALIMQQRAIVHALSTLCTETGASGLHVSKIIATDSRIAVHPGRGFLSDTTGHCYESALQRDIEHLVHLSNNCGLPGIAKFWAFLMQNSDTRNSVVHSSKGCTAASGS